MSQIDFIIHTKHLKQNKANNLIKVKIDQYKEIIELFCIDNNCDIFKNNARLKMIRSECYI